MATRKGSRQQPGSPPPKPPRHGAASFRLASLGQRQISALAAVAVLGLAAIGWLLWPRPVARPNLLVVTIDTLRADRVGAYGYGQAVTPALDGLAARGARFVNAHTAVPLTGPSHATIFTGHYPPVHGVRGNVTFTLGSRHPTLATLLKQHGYATGAFVGAYPVAAAFGFGQGFDEFNEGFHEAAPGDAGAERPANEVVDAALAWLGRHDRSKPFLAWLHFYDPHAPYAPPPPFHEQFRARPYDGEVAFTDAQLARVLDWLAGAGLEANTVVVVVADHGEGLGDHHEQTHGVLVYESTMRVPLIVAGPAVPAGRVVTARVATVDLLPTMLGLLGLDDLSRQAVGRDLRHTMTSGAASSDGLYGETLFGRLNCRWAALRVWIRGDWKLVQGVEPELYNLAADPGELHDLAVAEPARVRAMTSELGRIMAAMSPGGDRAQANQVTPEQEERLRSLGYAAGSPGGGTIDEPGLPDPRTHVVYYDQLQAASVARGPAVPDALNAVQSITRIDPNNPFAFGVLASMAYRFGSLGTAAQAFARALQLDPDRPGLRQNYGKLLRELNRLSESERELRIAVEQAASDDWAVRISLAETLIAGGKLDEAGNVLAAMLATQPNNPELLGARGRLLLARGELAEAIASLEQGTATSEPEPWVELADAYLRVGNAGRAVEAGRRALEISPGHPWAMAVTGRALVVGGQRPQGLELLARALASRPRRPAAWLALAEGFEAAGDRKSAATCRREAEAIAAS